MAVSTSSEQVPPGIRITDDELAAVAVAVGTPCPIRLATVDEADHEQLLAAVARGRRALTARGLLLPDGTSFGQLDPGWLDLVGNPMRTGVTLVACAVNVDLEPLGGLLHYFLQASDPLDWTLVSVLGGGLHQVTRVPRDIGIAMVAGLIEQAAADQEQGSEARLCLLSRPGGSPRTVLVSDRHLLLRHALNDEDVSAQLFNASGVGDALVWLHLDEFPTPPRSQETPHDC